MSLLELERVSKRYGHRQGQRVALREVSLQIDTGELVAVWGRRRSGRSTLLRLAAGVEAPDEGVVRFAGRDLAAGGVEGCGGGVSFCRSVHFVRVRVASFSTCCWYGCSRAASRPPRRWGRHAAHWSGSAWSAARGLSPEELDEAEAVRVAIARSLACSPRLLVIDEPTKGVELLERDRILLLLRSLANEGIAVLMSVGEASCLAGVDRALTIGDGELHGRPNSELAPVLPLRRPAAGRVSA